MEARVTPVTIVGGGPTGLALAVELLRRGIACRVLEKNLRRTDESRALAVHARTLEVFENLGIAEEAVREGRRISRLNAYWGGKRAFSLHFPRLDTAYAFVLSLPQGETERLLEQRVEALGGRLERGTELTDLRQDASGVQVSCRTADGRVETFSSRWAVACDGAHSLVRQLLSLPFEGETYAERFALADVVMEWPYPEGEANVFFSEEGPVAGVPLPGEHRVRLICQLGEEEATGGLFLERLQAAQAADARIRDVVWLSAFRIHRRMVPRFRAGRIFLAGDAAHIHSPVGGQGMNTGIQDAENLGWKLAAVERGEAPEELLESYDEERRPVAEEVLKQTHRATRLATLHSKSFQRIRNRVGALLVRIPPLEHRIMRAMAELAFTYRSRIAEEHWPGALGEEGPRAGSRAPDALGGVVRLYGHLDGLRPTLLLFTGAPGEGHVRRLLESAGAVRSRYGERIRLLLVSAPAAPAGWTEELFPDPDGSVHRAYHVSSSEALYLLRPDRYVGFRCRPADPERLLAYLARLLS